MSINNSTIFGFVDKTIIQADSLDMAPMEKLTGLAKKNPVLEYTPLFDANRPYTETWQDGTKVHVYLWAGDQDNPLNARQMIAVYAQEDEQGNVTPFSLCFGPDVAAVGFYKMTCCKDAIASAVYMFTASDGNPYGRSVDPVLNVMANAVGMFNGKIERVDGQAALNALHHTAIHALSHYMDEPAVAHDCHSTPRHQPARIAGPVWKPS